MTKLQKLNITLTAAQMRLLKRRARRLGDEPEAVLGQAIGEALEALERREAQEKLMASWGDEVKVSAAQAKEIRKLWRD